MKETICNIDNTPRGEELWRSISGNFQRFPQILNELVDDALSNFRAYAPAQRRVEIHLAHRGNHVEVTVPAPPPTPHRHHVGSGWAERGHSPGCDHRGPLCWAG